MEQFTDSDLLCVKRLSAYIGLSRASIYESLRDGKLPQPTMLVRNSPRWEKSEIDAFLRARAQERFGGRKNV
ncbi:helix-turn-helix transcriptional regulator [Vandammella animalimorsus]|uniref:AlpA family transcriptional regulator n=1 Tax=Vandammella animalimorsus TaxID=2029117 RepID=A0A2A2ABV3_9BURK|nr:AlpA family phage regulatory protein [Vandammella animalimorsus]PAT35069.1 hypothetical protein CK620_03880 [Vandammella animalimorsus]